MTCERAMGLYGSDRPDTNFEMPICDITKAFENTDFTVLKTLLIITG
ncbi:MAG: hypothetical protein V8R01_05120 [Bacilli bacterium]